MENSIRIPWNQRGDSQKEGKSRMAAPVKTDSGRPNEQERKADDIGQHYALAESKRLPDLQKRKTAGIQMGKIKELLRGH